MNVRVKETTEISGEKRVAKFTANRIPYRLDSLFAELACECNMTKREATIYALTLFVKKFGRKPPKFAEKGMIYAKAKPFAVMKGERRV